MSLFLSLSAMGEEIKTIRIATPAWEKQTNEDGTGLFFDIIRRIYEPEGIKMAFEIVPWKRAENMVALNHADAMLCVAEQNIGDQLSSRYPIYADSVVAIFKKEKAAKWNGQKSLEKMKAIWLRGYDMHKNPGMGELKLNFDEIDSHDQAWKMLKNNRAEVYIETLVDVWEPAKRNGIDMNNYQAETLWTENYYVAFSKSDKSKELIEIYDKKIPEMLQSGELKKLFEKWEYEFLPDVWKPKRDS